MKNCWKLPKWLCCWKGYIFSNYERYRSQILIIIIEDLNESFVQISLFDLLYFPRNKTVRDRYSRVGSGWFGLVLKWIYKLVYKVLELFECRRDDPHINANRNFAVFTRYKLAAQYWTLYTVYSVTPVRRNLGPNSCAILATIT